MQKIIICVKKDIPMIILGIIISFIILWCINSLYCYEYQSDYHQIGTVIDKTIIEHWCKEEVYLTVRFENGKVCTYESEQALKTLAINKTYEFRFGRFLKNYYGRKKNEIVEKIISVDIMK